MTWLDVQDEHDTSKAWAQSGGKPPYAASASACSSKGWRRNPSFLVRPVSWRLRPMVALGGWTWPTEFQQQIPLGNDVQKNKYNGRNNRRSFGFAALKMTAFS